MTVKNLIDILIKEDPNCLVEIKEYDHISKIELWKYNKNARWILIKELLVGKLP